MHAVGSQRVQAAVVGVDVDGHVVRCSDGRELEYDSLVLATGAEPAATYPEALTFSETDPSCLDGLLHRIEHFDCSSVAMGAPSGSWVLPAYELALMIARLAFDWGYDDLPIHVVTPERIALEIFGAEASAAVREVLRMAGVSVHTAAEASDVRPDGTIVIQPGPWRLGVEAVIALPAIEARPVPGVPVNARGFVPTDDRGRVIGVEDVHAVGDVAAYPVKHGGIATQQADVAAADIAARAGAPVATPPFRPVLRGMLLTGGRPRFLRHALDEPSAGVERVTRPAVGPGDQGVRPPPLRLAGRHDHRGRPAAGLRRPARGRRAAGRPR